MIKDTLKAELSDVLEELEEVSDTMWNAALEVCPGAVERWHELVARSEALKKTLGYSDMDSN